MELVTLQAERRTDTGKGVARKLRQNGRVPAVCYGLGKDPVSLTIEPRAIIHLIRGPLGRNIVFNLAMGDDEAPRMVTLKEMQVHPVKRKLLHVDFLEISEDSRLVVDVPVRVEGKSEADEVGGRLAWMLKTIRVSCAPALIPADIVVDVTGLAINDVLYVESLELPDGVEAVTKPRVPIVAGRMARGTDEDEAELEGETSEEGEEAAAEDGE